MEEELLRGNFVPKKRVVANSEESEQTLDERFEEEALRRLGGSIAFVAKKKVVWDLDEE